MSSVASELRLPPDRFFWAVLDASQLPRSSRGRRTRLGFLFESVLPAPIEAVHASYLAISDANVLACGMDRATLRSLAEPGRLIVGPDGLPGFITGVDVPVNAINLLSGEFEPREISRARGRLVAIACGAIVLLGAILLWGQARRADAQLERAHALALATQEIFSKVLPSSHGAAPASARLTAELRSLERTRGASVGAPPLEDVTPALAGLLAAWPADLHLTTEALSASAAGISFTVQLPDEASAERFERGLGAPPGWRMDQPDVQRQQDGLTMRVRMRPEVGP